jgi:hypothetical protein
VESDVNLTRLEKAKKKNLSLRYLTYKKCSFFSNFDPFWTILTPFLSQTDIEWQDRQASCTRMDVLWLKDDENHIF